MPWRSFIRWRDCHSSDRLEKYTFFLLIVAGGIGFFILLYLNDLDFISIGRILARGDILFFLGGVFCVVCVPILRALRWKFVLDHMGMKVDFFGSLALTAGSAFVASVTPAKLGEAVRLLFVEGQKRKAALGILLECYFDLIALCLIAICFWGRWFLDWTVWRTAVCGSGLCLFSVGISCLLWPSAGRMLIKLKQRPFKDIAGSDLLSLFQNHSIWMVCLGFSTGIYCMTFLSGYLIFWGIAYPIGLTPVFVALAVGQVGGLLSFLPMGLGAREASALGTFVAMGYESGSVMAGLVVYRILSLMVVALGGFFYFRSVKIHFGENTAQIL